MQKQKRLILVTNDDGYQARGFAAAVELAREFGDVIAVAPATPQSGRSQAITFGEPLYLDKRHEEEGLEIYSFTGTPVDCVKIAFDHLLLDRKVDLVISGINHGSNAAINVLYSGTMGAAIEGSFYGIPAVGLSLTDHSPDADFTAAKEYGRRIVRSVLESEREDHGPLCLNVNVPDIPLAEIRASAEVSGVRSSSHARHPTAAATSGSRAPLTTMSPMPPRPTSGRFATATSPLFPCRLI